MPAPIPTVSPLLNPHEAWWARTATRDPRTAVSLLQTEIAGGRHQHTVYGLFAEMLEKDGHLYAVLQTRLNGLLGLPRRLFTPTPDSRPGSHPGSLHRFLDAVPRVEELLRALLDGIAKGFAVVELHWRYDRRGHIVLHDWTAHPQEWFAFDARGGLLLLAPPFEHGAGCGPLLDTSQEFASPGRHIAAPRAAFAPPPRKFLVLRFGADCRNHHGRGLCQHAYWYYWFKKNALKFWAIFNERYGSPTAVATYAPGTPAEERERLREILAALQTESGVILPETIQLRFLDGARAGDSRGYRDFLDWCNDEMSKIVLGATLTSGEGRRSGSLALGGIHELVRQDYIEADARLLEGVLNGALIPWMHELSGGAPGAAPRLAIDTDSPEDLNRRVAVDRELLALGVPLPKAYFHERYGRPAPADGEEALRYDDANFYQYHLQFGVLTVNEVRARLGLPAVPWGGVPTAASGTPTAAAAPEDANRQIL